MAHCVSVSDSKKEKERAVEEGGVEVRVCEGYGHQWVKASPNAASLVPKQNGENFLSCIALSNFSAVLSFIYGGVTTFTFELKLISEIRKRIIYLQITAGIYCLYN